PIAVGRRRWPAWNRRYTEIWTYLTCSKHHFTWIAIDLGILPLTSAQTRRRFKRLQLSYRSLCCMPAIGDGHHLDLQVGRKAIVRSAAPGRHFPKCAASSGADISAAAAVAASGRHGPCSVPTAA